MDKKPNIPERWHGSHHYSNKLNIFFVLFLVFAALSFLWFYLEVNKLEEIAGQVNPSPTKAVEKPQVPGEGVVCTLEAKLCPDGVTYVGRGGPKCEFAPCPTSP
jgi:hypothetical protein